MLKGSKDPIFDINEYSTLTEVYVSNVLDF